MPGPKAFWGVNYYLSEYLLSFINNFHKASIRKGEKSTAAHNAVVKQGNIDQLQGVFEGLSNVLVSLDGKRVATKVIVGHDQGPVFLAKATLKTSLGNTTV